MGSFTFLESPSGPNVVINYSENDFLNQDDAFTAFITSDPSTQEAIIAAGDMGPYFGEEVEGANGSDNSGGNSGGYPELPQGSSRNKIEFLYNLMKEGLGGPPDVSAYFELLNSDGSSGKQLDWPQVLGVNSGEMKNSAGYVNDYKFNFYNAVRYLGDYAEKNGMQASSVQYGFDVTIFFESIFFVQGETLTKIREQYEKPSYGQENGPDYHGQMKMQVSMKVNGKEARATAMVNFFEDVEVNESVGKIELRQPLNFNVTTWLAPDGEVQDYEPEFYYVLSVSDDNNQISFNADDSGDVSFRRSANFKAKAKINDGWVIGLHQNIVPWVEQAMPMFPPIAE